jgi:outer membrane protein assembly factor BamB
MNSRLRIVTMIFGLALFLSVQPAMGQNWIQWRGAEANGIVADGDPPIEWSEETNLKWKTDIPGIGQSTPAVWGNTLFVTSALSPETDPEEDGIMEATKPVKFMLFALDRGTGRIKWERLAREEIPHQTRNTIGTWATASPITDGTHVFAFFGSRGLYCYTLEGELVWERDFGDMDTGGDMGEGASPALYEGRLIVNWDHYGEDFIAALDASTGEEIWKKKRDERISWTTPLVIEAGGRTQVITVAEKWIQSYDLESGDVLWKSAGNRYNNISTPVVSGGILYVGSGLREGQVQAIRLEGASGDISGSESILWEYDKFLPYVSSPLVCDGCLYFLKNTHGFLTCLDAATGEAHYANKRISGIRYVFASPVVVKDRIYILGNEGASVVIAKGPEYKVLASNSLDDKFDASPVVIGDELYLRGHRHLYCIAK